MFTCFSLKTMDFDVKHLKLLKLLVFGKAIGCPGCFSRSEGWVEQSESCHWKRWNRTFSQNSRKYPQIPKWRRANIFRFSGFGDGPTWQCRTVKWYETPETPEITGKRKLLIFSRRMNLQAVWFLSPSTDLNCDTFRPGIDCGSGAQRGLGGVRARAWQVLGRSFHSRVVILKFDPPRIVDFSGDDFHLIFHLMIYLSGC